MYAKKDKADRLLEVTNQKYLEKNIHRFVGVEYMDLFQNLLNKIAKKSQYDEGELITNSDLFRIKETVATIHKETRRNMVMGKGTLLGKERIQYDPFSALVTLNDYLYAMTMKALGSPYIPESFGTDMQGLIRDIAHEAEFEIKINDYNKTSVDKCYEKQRRQNAKDVKKATVEMRKLISSKKASPYRVAQYAGEYFALKKRQEGHGRVWRFFHKKENEARTKLLADMKKTLETVLKADEELDMLSPIEVAKTYNMQNLAGRANEIFQSGIPRKFSL